MILKDKRLRVLKGFIHEELMDSRSIYSTMLIILLCYFALLFTVSIATASTIEAGNSNGGALTVGFGTAVITMFISGIVMAGRKEMKTVFLFPIDRITYTLGNFIMFAVSSFILLSLSSIAFIFEFVIFKLLSFRFDRLVYESSVTLPAFLTGFWVSLCYILFISTLTYFIFILFTRYKLIAVTLFAVAAGLPFFFSFGRRALFLLLMFFLSEQSVVILSLKLLIPAVVFQCLSYLPLRSLEVDA